MKLYTVRLSFTDRREGPGTGRTIEVKASSFHTAIKVATRRFWLETSQKQHNDIRRDGLRVEIREKVLDSGTEA